MRRRNSALLFAVRSLAACNRQAGERRQAAGEILEGSVSDAMIHTDQVRSEGPYAEPKAAKGEKPEKKSTKGTVETPDATVTAEPSVATAAPAPQPTPSATE